MEDKVDQKLMLIENFLTTFKSVWNECENRSWKTDIENIGEE